jgi:S-formylglutathione hydrolase
MKRTRQAHRMILFSLFYFLLLTTTGVCQGSSPTVGVIERVVISAPSLAGNALGDSTSQKALVYLPPGYKEHPSHRYPVLYLLHGFSLGAVLEDWGEVTSGAMDHFVSMDASRAFIVVIPNGANKVFGSFYLNSPASGNWERYITEDVIHYVDENYRTIPNRRSRGIVGHSMGGFAALRFAMLHSDLFNTVYAMSPCCLDFQDDFTSSNPEWLKVVKLKTVVDIREAAANKQFWTTAFAAFAIAASPNPKISLSADLPYRMQDETLVSNPDVIERWRAAMPLNLINGHEYQLKSLAGLAIDFGYEDDFTHIPDTSIQFGRALLLLRVPVFIEGYHGDHNDQIPARVSSRVIPFIADHLVFAP